MNRQLKKVWGLLLGLVAVPAHALKPMDVQIQEEIQRQYKVTVVNMITNYTGSADEFKADGKPETLEIVMLPPQGKSEIRGEGQVLFLASDLSDDEQQELIGLAFEQRAMKAIYAR